MLFLDFFCLLCFVLPLLFCATMITAFVSQLMQCPETDFLVRGIVSFILVLQETIGFAYN